MEMELKSCEFKEFQSLIYRESGIKLEDGKEHLIQFRLSERLNQLGMKEFGAYLNLLRRPEALSERVQFLDAISTNTTSFFREPAHFDFAKDTISDLRKKGQKLFRFWSAACSSGEEPYSLAMALSDACLPADTEIKISGSDLSTRILDRARAGLYDRSIQENIPQGLLSRHFDTHGETQFQVKQEIRAQVTFQRQNLLSISLDNPNSLDFIFLRNVMIYFDYRVRNKIIEDCYRLLKPGGFLLIGHSESLSGLESRFKCIKPSYYLKGAA